MSHLETRGEPASTAGDAGAKSPVAPPEPARAANSRNDAQPRLVPPATPALAAFQAGPETRLRDLLAFALATEADKPVTAGDLAELRQKAEAELNAHAFRTLHNQVETIRLEAATEALARTGRALGFGALVLANLVAIAIAAGGAFLLWRVLTRQVTGA